MSYAEQYQETLCKKYLRQVIVLKSYLKSLYPDKTEEDIFRMVSRIGHYHYKKRPKLTEQETQLYQHLLKMGVNPRTLEKWFRASLVPEDVKNQLEQGLLTQKQALTITRNRQRRQHVNAGMQIIEEIRAAVKEVI